MKAATEGELSKMPSFTDKFNEANNLSVEMGPSMDTAVTQILSKVIV